MNAIPTVQIEEHFIPEEKAGEFPKMFDSTDSYKGQAVVDLTTGWIDKCREEMRVSWVAAIPAEENDPNIGPVVLQMSESRIYDLERVR